jgi:hypothetical protein
MGRPLLLARQYLGRKLHEYENITCTMFELTNLH